MRGEGGETQLIASFDELWPVADRAGEVTHVDVVKRELIRPLVFDVVDNEADIGRNS